MNHRKSTARLAGEFAERRKDEGSSDALAPASGFIVERRFFIRAVPIAIAALALGLPEQLSGKRRDPLTAGLIASKEGAMEPDALDFAEFIKECAALAKAAMQDANLNEEAHLF